MKTLRRYFAVNVFETVVVHSHVWYSIETVTSVAASPVVSRIIWSNSVFVIVPDDARQIELWLTSALCHGEVPPATQAARLSPAEQ